MIRSDDMAWRTLRALGRGSLRRNVDLTVEGLEHLPAQGPVIVAARHVHHLFDGCALVGTIPRPTHIVVALDWMPVGAKREALSALCRAARWPGVIRTTPGETSSRDPELLQRLRAAIDLSVEILSEERVLIVFPEGYPNIDPNPTPKQGLQDRLPFQPGYLIIAERLTRRTGEQATIVPTGLEYREGERWDVTLRFGEPVTFGPEDDRKAVNQRIEDEVARLSGLAS